MCKVYSLANQKGGVGKSVTTANLGIGLARQGKKVLVVDCDPQNSLTISLGIHRPDTLSMTLAGAMERIMSEQEIDPLEGIIYHAEGIDLMPANISLDGIEINLATAMCRETIIRRYLEAVKPLYDYVL